MALSKDVEYAVETLIDLGVLHEEGLERLAGLFRGLKAFSGALSPTESRSGYYAKPVAYREEPAQDRGNGRGIPEEAQDDESEPFDDEAPSAPVVESRGYQPRKRAARGSFNVPKLELQNLRDTMTVKQIAELKGVSPATVNNKLREYGLTEPGRRGRPAKK